MQRRAGSMAAMCAGTVDDKYGGGLVVGRPRHQLRSSLANSNLAGWNDGRGCRIATPAEIGGYAKQEEGEE